MSGLATPAIAIAAFVRSRDGAASSAEIRERFWISQSTLRRRRPELARLGILFHEDGNRSFYATRELTKQLPSKYQPQEPFSADSSALVPEQDPTQRARENGDATEARPRHDQGTFRAATRHDQTRPDTFSVR